MGESAEPAALQPHQESQPTLLADDHVAQATVAIAATTTTGSRGVMSALEDGGLSAPPRHPGLARPTGGGGGQRPGGPVGHPYHHQHHGRGGEAIATTSNRTHDTYPGRRGPLRVQVLRIKDKRKGHAGETKVKAEGSGRDGGHGVQGETDLQPHREPPGRDHRSYPYPDSHLTVVLRPRSRPERCGVRIRPHQAGGSSSLDLSAHEALQDLCIQVWDGRRRLGAGAVPIPCLWESLEEVELYACGPAQGMLSPGSIPPLFEPNDSLATSAIP